jgi:hypothetical protein
LKLAASTVWRLARGDRKPGLEVAQNIKRWSKGKVPLTSWAQPQKPEPKKRAAQ